MENPFDNQDEHDRYLRKNLALSRAFEIDKQDKQKSKTPSSVIAPVMQDCHKCKENKLCTSFMIMQTITLDGSASVSKERVYFCLDCSPDKKKKDKQMSKKQINALLRGAKKGRL
ncbi:MAG: hypothetical protein HRT90_09765 [Candidatus Margulisbacteria bacterium]|nr:hypothetical protein [Candidatus Margulisiibacteriota bacterium]